MTRNPRPSSVWMSVLTASVVATAVLIAQERTPQNQSIRAADLRADLFFLAGDALQGRLTGTPTNLMATISGYASNGWSSSGWRGQSRGWPRD